MLAPVRATSGGAVVAAFKSDAEDSPAYIAVVVVSFAALSIGLPALAIWAL
jgi:hypothetical protein